MLSSGRKLTSYDIFLLLRTAEQSGSRAPNPAQHKTFVVRGVPQHKGTRHLWCSMSRPKVLGKNLLHTALSLIHVPCTQQCSEQPVPRGWCQLVLCTLSRGNGVSCGCPAHQVLAATVTHAAGFRCQPIAPPGLSLPLPPFLGREGCEISSLS